MTLKMKGVLIFLFALLAIFLTVEGQSRKIVASLKIGRKTWTTSEAPVLCPFLRALKGCDFICHLHLCNHAPISEHGLCKTKCETKPADSCSVCNFWS